MVAEHKVKKFNEDDRKNVIDFLFEKGLLTPWMGDSPCRVDKDCRTIYVDNKDQCHLIIGGHSGWAGIQKDSFSMFGFGESYGLFIFAHKRQYSYCIYRGELEKLIANKAYLKPSPKKNPTKYTFNYYEEENELIVELIIDGIPHLHYKLMKVEEIPIPPQGSGELS